MLSGMLTKNKGADDPTLTWTLPRRGPLVCAHQAGEGAPSYAVRRSRGVPVRLPPESTSTSEAIRYGLQGSTVHAGCTTILVAFNANWSLYATPGHLMAAAP